jgi:hypothetical protein
VSPSGYPLHHLHGFASLAVSVVPLLSLSLRYVVKGRSLNLEGFKNLLGFLNGRTARHARERKGFSLSLRYVVKGRSLNLEGFKNLLGFLNGRTARHEARPTPEGSAAPARGKALAFRCVTS